VIQILKIDVPEIKESLKLVAEKNNKQDRLKE